MDLSLAHFYEQMSANPLLAIAVVFIAGRTGSAIALYGSLAGVNGSEWRKVIYGIFIPVTLDFGLGWSAAGCRLFLHKRNHAGSLRPD